MREEKNHCLFCDNSKYPENATENAPRYNNVSTFLHKTDNFQDH